MLDQEFVQTILPMRQLRISGSIDWTHQVHRTVARLRVKSLNHSRRIIDPDLLAALYRRIVQEVVNRLQAYRRMCRCHHGVGPTSLVFVQVQAKVNLQIACMRYVMHPKIEPQNTNYQLAQRSRQRVTTLQIFLLQTLTI